LNFYAEASTEQTAQVYKSIPKIADNVNEFSAKIGTTGVVTDENTDWISGDCTNATPQVCTLSATLDDSLNCSVVVLNNSPSQNTCTIASETNSSVSLYCQNNSNLNITTAVEKRIICQKQGDDFKMPTVQPVLVNQVVTNSGDPVKICRIRQISETTTASFESPDDCFGSGSRTAAGKYGFTFSSGYFKTGSLVDCSCFGVGALTESPLCSAENMVTAGKFTESQTIDIRIQNASATPFDRGFMFICYGEQP